MKKDKNRELIKLEAALRQHGGGDNWETRPPKKIVKKNKKK